MSSCCWWRTAPASSPVSRWSATWRSGSRDCWAKSMSRSSTCSVRHPPRSCALDPPAIVVPAFLSRGYHVNTDIPDHVAASGHTESGHRALGPARRWCACWPIARPIRLASWRSVVLAAAGTSDPAAQRDLHTVAAWFSAITGSRVELAFAATGEPRVAEAVSACVAAALVAWSSRHTCCPTGYFPIGYVQRRRRRHPAAGHPPGEVRLIANRFRRARVPWRRRSGRN